VTTSTALFQATYFPSRTGAEPRSVIVRAASFVEAEQLADKLMASLGYTIEQAPTDLPPLALRERNGVPFMVPKRGMP
jgi:hypothetical protein